MGALCGKQSKDDNFVGAGRTLSASPAQPASAALPANKRVVGGPARTLGEGSSGANPRDAARMAAEERDKAAKAKGGKLGQQLRQQKGMTDNEVIKNASQEEAQRRLLDQKARDMTYD